MRAASRLPDPRFHFAWFAALLDCPDEAIGTKEIVLAAVLREHWNTKTGQLNPGTAVLMRRTRLSEATVKRARKTLIDQGWLEVVPGDGWTRSAYALTLPAGSALRVLRAAVAGDPPGGSW